MIDEMLDEGIVNVLGADRVEDLTKKKREPTKETPVDAEYSKQEETPAMKSLTECIRHIAPIGIMAAVVFTWQMTGRLEQITGFWALIVLALLGGVTIGKYAKLVKH